MIINLHRLLANPAAVYLADHILAFDETSPVSWAQFCVRVSAWELTFAGVDVASIAVYQRNGVEFLATLLAIWRTGKHALLPANNLPATVAQLEQLACGFAGEFAGINCLEPTTDFVCPITQKPLVSLAATAAVLYTSGSSGAPEPVAKTFAQLDAELASLEQFRGAQVAGAVTSGSVSHQHIYGLLFRLLWPLVSGRPFIARERDYWEELAADSARHPRLAFVTSPAHLNRFSPVSFASSPVAIFSSGAPLAAATAEHVSREIGSPIIEVYGSTETGGIAWREQVSNPLWQCLPGVSVDLEEESGLLRVQSPHLPGPEWFVTADIARMDADRFELLGRADRIAKVGGKRISLTAVEQLIRKHSWVHEVRVLVLPERGDRVAAVVVLTEDGRHFLQTNGRKALNGILKQGLDHALERIAIPRYWRYPVGLPLNSQGKVTQVALQELFMLDVDNELPSSLPKVVVQQTQAGIVQFALELPHNLVYFDGHFPGNPVLPGVVQIHWAVHYATTIWGDLGEFNGLEAIKFQQLVLAGMPLTLELEYVRDKRKLYFSYRNGSEATKSGTCSSGRILFTNAL